MTANKPADEREKYLIGTMNFIAPEVFQKVHTCQSDVWSFGCTLLEIVNRGNFRWDVEDADTSSVY